MDLQADVLPGAERAADAAEREQHRLRVEAEARGDLLAILVQPLRGDVQLDGRTARPGHRQRRLQPEERLVLHAQLVRALDDHVADQRLVAAHDALVADDVAVGVDRLVRPGDGHLRIDQRLEHLVGDDDRGEGAPARLRVVRRDRGDRLADVAHDVAGEHRLVLGDQPVRRLAGHVVGGDDRLDAVDLPGARHVDRHDARRRVRRAQRRAPEEAVGAEVAGEGEAALHLGDARRAA